MDGHWNERFTSALLAEGDEVRGWLRQDAWYPHAAREPEQAWVATRLREPEEDERRGLARFLVELPAEPADTPERRRYLLGMAQEALCAGPDDDGDPPAPPAMPMDVDERHRLIDRLLSAWSDAQHAITQAASREAHQGAYARFRTLAEALQWAYTVDQVLQSTWCRLAPELREQASAEADRKAAEGIEHNRRIAAQHDVAWSADDDRALAAFRARREDHRPYRHWSSLLLAGTFDDAFFEAVGWIRGKLTHEGIDEPIELRAMCPGGEPRWKWKRSDAVVAGGRRDAGRSSYDAYLAEQDVLGLFSWLVEVFVEAKWLFYGLMRQQAGDSTR